MTNLFLLIVAGVFIWLAVSAALKGGAKNPIDAFQHVSGFTVSVMLILTLIIFALPTLISYMANSALPQFWGPVFSEAWDDAQEAGATAADMMSGRVGVGRPEFVADDYKPVPISPPVVTNPQEDRSVAQLPPAPAAGEPVVVQAGIRHTVAAGDTLKEIADKYGISVSEIVSKNGIANPNRIAVGDTFVIQDEVVVVPTAAPVVTVPTSTPAPIATPMKDWSDEFNRVEAAKVAGDMSAGVEIINEILRSEPSNVIARSYQTEVQLAYDVVSEWEALTYGAQNGSLQAEIESALAGFDFRVKSIDDGWNVTTKQEEAMVLVCTSSNWLNGREVTISRFVGERMGFKNVGDSLKVGG